MTEQANTPSTPNVFDVNTFDVQKFDSILARGLSHGIGAQDSQMCIEAAICTTLGLPHGDNPKCVTASVRAFKITLNDSNWSSPEARAKGLRNLGLAQLGSLGVVDSIVFSEKLSEKTIRVLIPKLFRSIFTDPKCLKAADRCESEGTAAASYAASSAADAADAASYAAVVASYAANSAASSADASSAADAASYAASSADAADASSAADAADDADADTYLILSASLALEVLEELHSPGCALLEKEVA